MQQRRYSRTLLEDPRIMKVHSELFVNVFAAPTHRTMTHIPGQPHSSREYAERYLTIVHPDYTPIYRIRVVPKRSTSC